jgi:splicing factor 3B subunit 3
MEKLGGAFNQVAVPLTYTPRQLVIHPESNMMVVIESDHNCLSDKAMREQVCACAGHALCSGQFYMLFE